MSDIIEIEIDRLSLPNDGQFIEWQTQEDFDNQVWKKGRFMEGDDLFCEGFEDTHRQWDTSWKVLHWKPLVKISAE